VCHHLLDGFAVGAAALLRGTAYERFLVAKAFKKDLQRISTLIEEVKSGKGLPTLEILLKTRDN
jgi:hypothetical protein